MFLLQLPCSRKQKPYLLAQIEMVPSPVAKFLGNLASTGAKPILSHAYIDKTDTRVSGRGPAYLSALFQQSARTHQHATRSASCRGIRVPQVRTELGKKEFAFRGALRWNGLPASIRASRSNDISSSIKSHLLTYSI